MKAQCCLSEWSNGKVGHCEVAAQSSDSVKPSNELLRCGGVGSRRVESCGGYVKLGNGTVLRRAVGRRYGKVLVRNDLVPSAGQVPALGTLLIEVDTLGPSDILHKVRTNDENA